MKFQQMLLATIFFSAPFAAHAASCSASTTGVSFGSYTPNQLAALDSAGTITISCSKGALDSVPFLVSYTIAQSRGSSASYSPRQMTSGSHNLQYNLYQDALRSIIWGDGSGGSLSLSSSLLITSATAPTSKVHDVYGRVFGSQNAFPGAYSDSVSITITY